MKNRRIKKLSYFGSGEEKSSNSWHQKCDLLLILGTPRLPLGAISKYLIQTRQIEAAQNPPEWSGRIWTGTNAKGEPQTVQGMGYLQPDWEAAQQALVGGILRQSIGRGRGLLTEGCDVILMSNMEIQMPGIILEDEIEPLSEKGVRVLQAVKKMVTDTKPKYVYIGKVSVKDGNKPLDPQPIKPATTKVIAKKTKLGEKQTLRILNLLEKHRLIERVGKRGGWRFLIS